MKNLIPIIVGWVKSHVITTAVISTIAVGGVVATPIVIDNIEDNKIMLEEEQPVKEEIEQSEENTENEQSVEENQTKVETQSTVKTENKPTTKIENNKKTESKSESKSKNETKEKNEQPSGFSVKNNTIFKNGEELIKFEIYIAKSLKDVKYGTPIFNESEIKALSKEEKKDVFNNYMCRAVPDGCKYFVLTGRNEPYHYVNYYMLDGQGHLGTIENIGYEMDMYNTCIKHLSENTLDELVKETGHGWLTAREYCLVDSGYTADVWKRSLENAQLRLENNRKDQKVLENLVNKTKRLIDLLNS